ncbi:MAG: ATP-dependent DNA helicase RecG, partial [Bacteroidota bacterium]
IRLAVKGEKRRKHLAGVFQDETGTIELKWFQGLKWIMQSLKLNTDYILFGRPTEFNGTINVIHPELESLESASKETASVLQPVYSTTEKLKLKGLDSKGFLRLQRQLLSQLPTSMTENLPSEVVSEYKFIQRRKALTDIHFPPTATDLKHAEARIKFEEFFFIQLRLLRLKLIRIEKTRGVLFDKVGDQFNGFYKHHLPFPLTEAQKRVIREIRVDCGSGKQMNRLLQGDVGYGKTVVALLCMLIAIDNGFQACLMAPTEILATQHAASIGAMLDDTGVQCALLTGSTKTAERKRIHAGIADGSIKILLGTHALIEDEVKFGNLGFVVIDEQHRFGVQQRARLWEKNVRTPHVLVMTATPIPRTLAMTLYGDLDVSIIDELPPGRKPVTTVHRFESNRLQVFGFMKKEIEKGRQVYVVYPLIEESEKSDLNNLMQGYEAVCREFPLPSYRVSIVHGKMKPADKDFVVQRFLKGEFRLLGNVACRHPCHQGSACHVGESRQR